MNTDTLIGVGYSADERAVILERGEASFDVVSDKARPFRVTAGSRIFEAVGTAFNIELVSRDKIELTVTEGTVRVTRRELMSGSPKPHRVNIDDSPNPVAFPVTAGQVAKLDGSVPQIDTPAPAVLQAALAWQSGRLQFQGERLVDALAEMNRYTPIRFEFADESIGETRIGGLYDAGDVGALLVALPSFGIEARPLGPNRYILDGQSSGREPAD
jgi:transmembrane sensor